MEVLDVVAVTVVTAAMMDLVTAVVASRQQQWRWW